MAKQDVIIFVPPEILSLSFCLNDPFLKEGPVIAMDRRFPGNEALVRHMGGREVFVLKEATRNGVSEWSGERRQ